MSQIPLPEPLLAEPAPPAEPILTVRDLRVTFSTEDGAVEAVKGIDLDVRPGETVAVVGESGSGKSQTMMAAMGLLSANGRATGSVRYRGEELIGLSPKALNRFRGKTIAMIFQEPMTSLDPLYRIGDQIAAPLMVHQGLPKRAAWARAVELLERVQIPDPSNRIHAYPQEMSGGQRQRVMIAMALANRPDVLIADEPTTALDVTVQANILKLLKELQAEFGMGIVFITHDLGIVRRFADRTYVMRHGRVVEEGATEALFANPREAYTRLLIEAEPSGRKDPPPQDAPAILTGDDVRVTFTQRSGLFGRNVRKIEAVRGIDLSIRRGETLGVVGESGSGKSTLGRAMLKLVPASGTVRYEDRNLTPLDRKAMRGMRRDLQLVFQDPFGSLSPRLTAGQIVTEGLLVHEPHLSRTERDRRAAAAFEEVSLEPKMRHRFPHEFSGGQRQRIAIARTMILNPKLVVLDEPTSALDRSVQKSIVELLRRLQDTHGLAYIFISHDLAVVRAMSDNLLVMKDGAVVERGSVEEVFTAPREPYTRELIAAAYLR